MSNPRKFNPVSKEWQEDTCNELGISLIERADHIHEPNSYLGEPSTCIRIKGDGNCLFRSLAFSVSGNEELHMYFRTLLTSFISRSKDPIVRDETPDCYLKRTRMRENHVWGTDIELYFAAMFLNCSIFVFSKHGKGYDWLEFKPSNSKSTDFAIYLHHKNGDHYDVVTSVTNSRLEIDLPVCEDENKTKPFILVDIDKQNEKEETHFNISMSNLSDILQSMSFEESDANGSIESYKSHVKEKPDLQSGQKEDPFEFENEDMLDYKREPFLQLTSTPKKIKSHLDWKQVSPKFKDEINRSHSEERLNISNISIFNSSFEENVKKRKPKSSKKKHSSILLTKALKDISSSIEKRKKCQQFCLKHVTSEMMKCMRYRFWTKSYDQRVEWFIDKVKESKCQRGKATFTIDGGHNVCSSCFQLLLKINKNFYYKYFKKATEGKSAASYRNTRGFGEAREGAILWLQNYEYFHADRMPDNGDMMLPFKTRKIDLYDLYVDEKIQQLTISIKFAYTVSRSAFYEVWKTEFPKLKIKQTNSFSRCSTCVHIDRELEKTRDPVKREKLKEMMSVHNQRQMKERRYYYKKRELARRNPSQFLSIIIDGMDQSKTNLPHFTGRLMKGVDPNSFLKTHIQGVLNHGLESLDLYVDINEYMHDANLVMNIILKSSYKALLKTGFLQSTLYIQADNCARENKNKYVLGFCELLVTLDIFKEVHLSFLHVGHTHEDIDAAFSQLSTKLRKSDAETMPKLLALLNGAKQLRGLFDLKTWLEPCLNQIKKHSKPLHFKFSRDTSKKVVMHYRPNSSRPWSPTEETMLHTVPPGKPKPLVPPSFHKIDIEAIRRNVEKQQYHMSGGSEYMWWQQYLEYLQLVKTNEDVMSDYAKKEADWLLPKLMDKQQKKQSSSDEIESHLHELLDRELDDHKIILSKAKPKKKGKKNQARR
ncbi:uncharacterized protein LOC134237971 [Saccostrea cucullata]|uniref:uncharacterized protein LOC134237971 n=1 Tax=Saccostrea cuccullata TaxID=36930 RepID=UPI002ED4C1C2